MAKKSTKSAGNASIGMPMEDTAWRARDDAETLRRAGEIMGDKGRVRAAQSELRKSMDAIKRVAGTPARSNSLGFAKKGSK